VIGKLSIAKNRLYLPVQEGGLGLIRLKDYVIAQQASWFKKSGNKFSDIWRYDLYRACFNNILIADPSLVSKEAHPVIGQLVESYREFKVHFLRKNNNFMVSSIMYNPLLLSENGNPALTERGLMQIYRG
jgi:hypothetical protein